MLDFVQWVWIIVLLVALYGVILYVLARAGRIGPEQPASLLGPLLMTRTRSGLSLLDRLGRFRRFWSRLSDLGILLAALAMLGIVVVLLVEAVLAFGIGAARAPTAQEAIGLPGINPFIPLGYGLLAIIIGVVIHELFHGIVARSQKIGVKSVGILWFVIPVGAFVEQDDKEMMAASRRARDRVAAAGVLANFLVSLVTFLVLAVLVTSSVHAAAPGVGITEVVSGTPAQSIGLQAGDIITRLNGTATTSNTIFLGILDASHPNQTMAITWWSGAHDLYESTSVKLATSPTVKTRGFLGVAPLFLAPTDLLTTMATPWSSSGGAFTGFLEWFVLPPAGASPIQGPTAAFFHVTGPLAALGSGNVLVLVNIVYWLTWMNLLLGVSNALPMIPLDGNLLFRDWVSAITARLRKGWTADQIDSLSARLTVASSLVVLFLILWQFVGPRL